MKSSEILLSLLLVLIISYVGADDQPECQEFTCNEECTYGRAIDVTGCPTCECKEEICQGVTCSLGKVCKKFTLTNTNSEIARCVDPTLPGRCQLPMDSGKCRSSQVKWFYDTDTNMCQEFTYGGCPGNDNTFETMAACDEACGTSCGDMMCAMYCEKGFKKDKRGCDICVCADEEQDLIPDDLQDKSFVVGLGCEEANERACDLHCEHGYQVDQYECEICACKSPPYCVKKNCDNECNHGFRTDEDGCPTCECRQMGECKEFVCTMYCEFGLKKDKDGCDHCECNPDPCTTTDCPDGTYCVLTNSTSGPKPTCLVHESWSPDCPSVSCMLYCQHGFKSDIRGCPVCECLETPKVPCPGVQCKRLCQFGFQKNEHGCDVCMCLPHPCKDKTCASTQVCETTSNCMGPLCTFSSKCSEKDAIKRVRVHVSFSHEKPLDPEHRGEFLKKMKTSYAEILKVDEAQITDMKANQDNKTVHVTFYVVKGGDKDLVQAWQTAETHILAKEKGSAITYNGQEFVPQEDSLVSLYSSSNAAAEPGDENGGSSTTTIIVVCCVVGVVVLVAAVVVSLFVSKSKKKKVPTATLR